MVLDLVAGLIIGIGHYFNETVYVKYEKQLPKLQSFSAGIAIAYILISLFPQFTEGVIGISKFLFLSVLAGFAAFHVIEKYIYKLTAEDKLMNELAIEDSITSFIYHFIVGIVIVSFLAQGVYQGFLFFIPIFLYTALGTLPVGVPTNKISKIILAASTLLGVLFARLVPAVGNSIVNFVLLGLVIGVLTYTVTRHSIPFGKDGRPLYFLIGVVIYSIIIIAGWNA